VVTHAGGNVKPRPHYRR